MNVRPALRAHVKNGLPHHGRTSARKRESATDQDVRRAATESFAETRAAALTYLQRRDAT